MPIVNTIIAAAILSIMVIIAISKPKIAILIMIAFLIVLGDLRRIIGYYVGPSDYDPLLLVAPLFVIILLIIPNKDFHFKQTKISKLVLALLIVMTLQIFNPIQGGIKIGFAGALFTIIPLCWFWIGNKYGDLELLRKLLFKVIIPLAIAAGFLGFLQIFYGFTVFEQNWIDLVNFDSLHIGSTMRPFSFFASPQEYASFLLIGLTATILSYKKNPVLFSIVSIFLFAGLFLASARGAIVMLVLALVSAIAISRAKNIRLFIPRFVFALILALLISQPVLTALNKLEPPAIVADLYNHQLMGLSKPLDQESSTVIGHINIVTDGLVTALKNPLGMGLGKSGNTQKFGSEVINLENDLSLFITTGIIGGVIYLIIVYLVIINSMICWQKSKREEIFLFTIILITALLNWFGGLYSISAIIWLAIGIINRYDNKNEGIDIDAIGNAEGRSGKIAS